MMGLSMVVIAAPGLGLDIVQALERVNVGVAFDAGLAIVIMAILLDRLATRASQRVDVRTRSGAAESARPRRGVGLGGAAAPSVAFIGGRFGGVKAPPRGARPPACGEPVNTATAWVEANLFGLT